MQRVYKVILLLFYIWIPLEGIIRKWLLPQYETGLFFIKYILIAFLILILLINKNRIRKEEIPFLDFFFFLLFYCVLQLININVSNHPIIPISGLVIYFFFSSIAFVLPKIFFTKEEIFSIFNLIPYLAIPIFLFGVYQYFSPLDSIVNKYSRDMGYIATVNGYPRITTIFSYLAGYTSFLNFVLVILCITLIKSKKINSRLILTTITLLLGLINLFMTGSRGPLGFFFIQFFFIALGTTVFIPKIVSLKQIRTLFFSLIFIVVAFIYSSEANVATDSFLVRVESNNDVKHRIIDTLNPFKFADKAGIIGYGIGTTYQGVSNYLTKRYIMPEYWEEESERIVIEIGVMGFILVMILRVSVLYSSWKIFQGCRDSNLKLIVLVLIAHQLPTVFLQTQQIFNWMENLAYWTNVGIILSINNINSKDVFSYFESHYFTTK